MRIQKCRFELRQFQASSVMLKRFTANEAACENMNNILYTWVSKENPEKKALLKNMTQPSGNITSQLLRKGRKLFLVHANQTGKRSTVTSVRTWIPSDELGIICSSDSLPVLSIRVLVRDVAWFPLTWLMLL